MTRTAPAATTGVAVYAAGHAGAKAALFGLAGVLLDRHGSVDEHGLYGRGRDLRPAGVLFAAGGLALAGLPPFATALGKAVVEHAAAGGAAWLIPLFVLVPAITGGAVLRAGVRVFAGRGAPVPSRPAGPETTGTDEEPEIRDPRRRVPWPMVAVPCALLGGSLARGLVPAFARAVAEAAVLFCDAPGYRDAVAGRAVPPAAQAPEAGWTVTGAVLGLLSAGAAVALAAAALWGPGLRGPLARRTGGWAGRVTAYAIVPLRRLHSGHVGDYAAWLVAGTAALLAVFAARI
ncbi:hypothetical protein [Streptomyces sp. NPDC091371]|uniref:hypothetical protein n=1 Tax=Streptomyces sp. NPDC091371 TaxID=3155303 RepID=UPI0034315227